MTLIQYGGLILFAGLLFTASIRGDSAPTAESFSWEWLNPMAIDGFDAMLGGFLVALFIFWGFDASLAMSPRSPPATPPRPGAPASSRWASSW